MLAVCVIVTIAHFLLKDKGLSVLQSLVFFSVWVVYALGSNDKALNNRVVKYLSKISMEIYLCHMLFFRVVDKIHLEQFIGNHDLLYVATFVLTLAGAIAFSHICKFKIINQISWLK